MGAALSRIQVREFDRRAAEEFGLPTLVLMENAARSCAEVLQSRYRGGSVVILCGKGNNGGDGLALARHLDGAGIPVRILLVAKPAELTPDSAVNLRIVQKAGIPLEILPDGLPDAAWLNLLNPAAWLVDALLGVGACGDPRTPLDAAINALNASPGKRLAIDLPSGLDADTGLPGRPTVQADITCTLVAPKLGFASSIARTYLGELVVAPIGAPGTLLREFGVSGQSGWKALLPADLAGVDP